ncbi:MAG: methyltransferase [Pseudomonadota bacterium]
MRYTLLLLAAAGMTGCQPANQDSAEPEPQAEAPADEAPAAQTVSASDRLDAVLAAQSDDMQARYQYRNPKETLEFFGVEPGMTVVEALPGGGWYSKILLPYLGSEGQLVGAAYELDMYALFPFASEEFMQRQSTWTTDWPVRAEDWRGADGADVLATRFGSMPADVDGEVDVVLMIRALHNLARFQNSGEGPYLDTALNDAFRVLRPGGVLGVVQHHARDDMPDDWAAGGAGYLKTQAVIDAATAAGFELVGESEVNANPSDQPTTEDIVWRLLPGLRTSENDAELRAELEQIGESNRMTLKFEKPAG